MKIRLTFYANAYSHKTDGFNGGVVKTANSLMMLHTEMQLVVVLHYEVSLL